MAAMAVKAAAADAAEAPKAEQRIKVKKDLLGKAIRALVQVVKKRNAGDQQLFRSDDETMQLQFTLGMIPEKRKMRPLMIQLPHPLYDENSEVCFFSKSPQKTYKEMLIKNKKVGLSKVIGLEKLRRNYPTLEAKKALCDAFDLFLCDASIVEMMPGALGKIFYRERNKVPLPIDMSRKHEENIKRAIGGTALRIPAGPCLGVKIGRCGMPEEHLTENAAVVIAAVAKVLHEQHRNYLTAVSVQATNSPALPVWHRPVTPGGPVDLKKLKGGKKAGDSTSSAASETGSSFASETEALDISEMPSDAGETLSTRDTVSEQETDTTHSEMDTEAGDVDSESAQEKQDMPLVKGLKKRAKRRLGAEAEDTAAATKRAAAEVEAAAATTKGSMPPPAKKAKKGKA